MKSIWVGAGCLLLAFVAGCNNDGVVKGVTVTGKVQRGGQVLKPTGPQAPGASKVEVIFYPADPNGVAEQAIADATTGEFKLVGAGKGIKPGTYKVGIFVRGIGFDSDELAGKFNQQNTTITRTIPEDKVGQTFAVDPIDVESPK